MNTFWKSFFATLLALVVFSLLMFFIVLGMVAAVTSGLEKKAVAVESHSILYLDLNYPIPEQTSFHIPFPSASIFSADEGAGLNDILRSIEAAADDPNIEAIWLQMGYNVNPYATLQEIRNALQAFRINSDKPVIAYGEVVNQSSYYLGSVADEVYLNPAGVLEFKGLAARLTFIKGTLDKLGIRTQVFWAGEFKSATEPLRLDKMSDQNREQLREYVGGLYDQILADISVSRKMPEDSLRSVANELMAWLPVQTVRTGLVDSLLYDDQLRSMLQERLELEEDAELVSVADYVESIPKQSGNWENQIAVVYMEGDIVDGSGQNGSIGSVSYRKILSDLRQDDEIKAVVLRINSGGGSAVASEVIWREIEALRAVKPVVVSMGDYAASGGYMIACSADKVFAQPNTLTGSIGVFMILPDISGFREDKLGMTSDTLLTGKFSDFPTISRPVSDAEAVKLQEGIDSAYINFKRLVANGRNMDMNAVEDLAKGRIWLGTTALNLGLVDALGSKEDAIQAAADLAELDTYRIHEYPEQKQELWEELFNSLANEQVEAAVWQEKLGDLFEPYLQVQDYLQHPIMRMELPYEVEVY